MTGSQSKVLISDFDGTISIDDFFWCAIKEYLDDNSLQPWNDYIDKKIFFLYTIY
jgi:2-hydroxy-3-keto-5-methylthiopentenyl-1-phosphate phosphatase